MYMFSGFHSRCYLNDGLLSFHIMMFKVSVQNFGTNTLKYTAQKLRNPSFEVI